MADDYSDSVALVYPASLKFEDAHVTIMFLGTVSENLAGRSADEIVTVLHQEPELNQYLIVRTTERVMFGQNQDIPVVLVDNPLLHHNRSVVEELLFDIGIESASAFTEYKPHITLPEPDYVLPKEVVIAPPTLWWGNSKIEIFS